MPAWRTADRARVERMLSWRADHLFWTLRRGRAGTAPCSRFFTAIPFVSAGCGFVRARRGDPFAPPRESSQPSGAIEPGVQRRRDRDRTRVGRIRYAAARAYVSIAERPPNAVAAESASRGAPARTARRLERLLVVVVELDDQRRDLAQAALGRRRVVLDDQRAQRRPDRDDREQAAVVGVAAVDVVALAAEPSRRSCAQ